MSSNQTIYEHPACPDWGRGALVESRDGKAVLQFEHGGRKILVEAAMSKLRPVDLPADAAAALGAKLRGRRSPAARSAATKKSAKSTTVSPYSTFSAQVVAFEAMFPGGFGGETFEKDERGEIGAKLKAKGNKAAAVAHAQETLSAEKFAQSSPGEIFDAVVELFRLAKLVHPLEGGLALGSFPEELRPAFVEALRDLLHGEGDYRTRFDAFVNSIHLKDAQGKPMRVSWPLATIVPAIVHPDQHICVSPTAYRRQAPLVNVQLDYQSNPSGELYEQFVEIAEATKKRLEKSEHAPRDLLDVSSFITRTQNAKVATAAK